LDPVGPWTISAIAISGEVPASERVRHWWAALAEATWRAQDKGATIAPVHPEPRRPEPSEVLDPLWFWVMLTRWGRLPRLWLACAAVMAATGPKGRGVARDSLVVALLNDRVVSWGFKPFFRRPRPVSERRDVPSDLSFPSAHAANGAAFVTVVGHAYPALRPGLVFLVGLISLSRVRLRHHHASDVVAGVGSGYAVARLCRRWVAPRLEGYPEKQARARLRPAEGRPEFAAGSMRTSIHNDPRTTW
jgi:membrane-associated phospholipid phosphatase